MLQTRTPAILFDNTQVQFVNPGTVETVTIDFNVKSFSVAGCPANTEAAHPQFLLYGYYFNSGSGNPWDDVVAFLMVERRNDDTGLAPNMLRVNGFMWSSGSFFNNVSVGTLQEGESATATLRWDRVNHAFVVRIERTITTPLVEEAMMPYSLADTSPPTVQYKSLQVGTFTPNCMGSRSLSAMEVDINKVRVNPTAIQ